MAASFPDRLISSGPRVSSCEASPSDTESLWPALGAVVVRNRFGPYIAARQWYATPDVCEPDARTLGLLLRSRGASVGFPARFARDPDKWLFLDTEATGFIGGSGSLAFLIGLAWWDSGGFQIEQLFMRDAAEEHAILFELARKLRKRPVLVTFNGKSFDWPLLVSRIRMTRAVATPNLDAHLDFLHPAREIWKLHIGRVKLGDLEERVLGSESLGWSRREDIDSGLIPGIYFDYVRGAATWGLDSVFRHNRMDLRGLAALAKRIFRVLSLDRGAESLHEIQALESYGISRFFGRRKEYSSARHYCEAALELGLPDAIGEQARAELAKLARRELRKAVALRAPAKQDQGARRAARSIPR